MPSSRTTPNLGPTLVHDNQPGGDKSDKMPQTLYNYEAERALLGAIFVNNRFWENINEIIQAEDFADPIHGRIFATSGSLIDKGQIADQVSLGHHFDAEEALEGVGGRQYLVRLAEEAILATDIRTYANIIHELALRRRLIATASELIDQARILDVDRPAEQLIESAEQALYNISEGENMTSSLLPFKMPIGQAMKRVETALKNYDRISGLPCGFQRIDTCLGGLQPSDLIIIAARPSMGKTALAANIAWQVASHRRDDSKKNGVVAYFSLEMSAEQLVTRILCQQTEINANQIRLGNIKQTDYDKIYSAARKIEGTPLYIDETPALTVAAMRTRARRLKRTQGLDLIVVDYLQLLSGSGRNSQDNRVMEISYISRSLKALAKELNIPVIALSQLSRKVEDRDDKHPQLADLRESGAIEQDADVVMFIYREAYYLYRSKPRESREGDDAIVEERFEKWLDKYQQVEKDAQVFIAKNRHGRIDTINLHFEESFTTFSTPTHDDHLPEQR